MCFKKLSIRGKGFEFLPALYTLTWGLWVVNPWANAFDSSGIFKLMDTLAPEWLWGALVGAVGLFQMITLFTPKCKLRAFAAILSMFTLFAMSMLVAFSNPLSTAMTSYLVIAICAWLGYTELLADVETARKGAKCK
jgi:hypothetical protein